MHVYRRVMVSPLELVSFEHWHKYVWISSETPFNRRNEFLKHPKKKNKVSTEKEKYVTKKGRNILCRKRLPTSLYWALLSPRSIPSSRFHWNILRLEERWQFLILYLFTCLSKSVCVYVTVSFRSLQLLFFFRPFVENVYIYSAYVILFPCILSAHDVRFRCELAIVFLMYQFENLFKIPKTYLLFVLVW